MLYAFYGEPKLAHEKGKNLMNSLRIKRPDAACMEMNADNWNVSILEGHLGGQGLFVNKYIIYLDRVSENAEAKEQILEYLKPMQESENIFIMVEGKVLAEFKKNIEKNAEKAVLVEEKKAPKTEFNIFSLGEALGMRKKERAWMIYREAQERGIGTESIAGTLFWQVKTMILARNASKASDSGLNPFVYNNSKRYASNYSKEELDKIFENIVTIYHNGHRGISDMELSLEKMILGL